MLNFEKKIPQINTICHSLSVKRLGLFGSVLTNSFSPNSDVDVLVVFDSDDNIDYFENYFRLKEQLEIIFERKVDLIVDKPFKNYVFSKAVEQSRLTIYESSLSAIISPFILSSIFSVL